MTFGLQYGSKKACVGAWEAPKSKYIDPGTSAYYGRMATLGHKVRLNAGWRGKCQVCGKDCSIRSDGMVAAHVNSSRVDPARVILRQERQAAAHAKARSGLIALRTELQEEGM